LLLPDDVPGRLRLLLAEDSEDDAALLLRELERGGFDLVVRRVDNEADFRAALADGPWDMVITDYNLRDVDGRKLLEIVRARGFEGPVIAVSGSLNEEQLVAAMRAGAHDFIQKGHLARLVPALRRELEEMAVRDARRTAESALGQTEERLRSVLLNMPVMLAAFGEDGQVLVWNRECESVTGYSAEDIVNRKDAVERLYPDAAYRSHLLADWSRRGREYREWEVRMTGRDGRVRTIAWSSVAASFPVPGWASWAVGTDVTERVQMETNLREANRVKDEFLATLSHELRTPLTAVLGWVHLLRSRKLDPPMQQRAIEVIDRNAKAQAQLIADILDVSRIVTGKFRLEPHAVDLAPVIHAAVDSVRPAAEAKQICVVSNVAAQLGLLVADPDRIQQVAWNLLSNSIKFTPEGGEVRLSVERVGTQVQISVTDTGAGIEPDLLPHVFERFRQGDSSSTRAHGGLGLGLAIVRHIVELHGGTVQATSAGTGLGATFVVSLPLRTVPKKDTPRPIAGEAAGPSLEGLSVLVVDDDSDTRELVHMVLSQRGARVMTAASVDEAMELFAARRPDILLSDIAMPGEDGFELIRRVRALEAVEGGSVKAAALTAYARTEDRLKALWAGFQTHIPKPVQPNELAVVVASLVGRTGIVLPESELASTDSQDS
jgi:PAS domain S-box-containing protein